MLYFPALHIVPLRLTGGTFAVDQQLSSGDKLLEYSKIKEALVSVFVSDRFRAYEQFITRKLGGGEDVDVYLADLRRLAELFGGVSDTGLMCAFVATLPESVRHILRASSRIVVMDLGQIMCRARTVLLEETGNAATAGVAFRSSYGDRQEKAAAVTCRGCGQPNHHARD